MRGDAVARLLIRVGDDGDAALLPDAVERLHELQPGRDELLDAQREDVTRGARHLHPRNPDEAVVGGLLCGLQTGVDLVVVGHGEHVETHCLRLCQQHVDGVTAVVRERGVAVELCL